MSEKIIVTSALPYVNNIPHIGTVVCVISADVYTKYLRLKEENVISILGTDEHGTTAETKAMDEGITPKQLVDKYFRIHKEIYEWFLCDFDCFGRTSARENHEISQDIFLKLNKNSYIVEKEEEHLFCGKCSKFLADRFVEGKCPFCDFPDARGDQCDDCGKLLNPSDLIEPRCKICGKTPVMKKSKHLFIDLPRIEPKLRKWISTVENKWSQNAKTMTQAWLKEGLRPRAITRDLKWGIPVPMKGYEDKVFYSWFDAPIGYISITAENRKDWAEWWKSKDTRLVQFMGKDNIPFHTILFPAFCIGADDNYTLLDSLSVNEYLNYEGGKFSKSRNIGIFGDDAMKIGIPADVWRYYIMINRPEKADTEFSWDDFQEKLNNELVANIGNLVNRTVTFLNRYFHSSVPEGVHDARLMPKKKEHIESIDRFFSEIKLKEALKEIMQLSKLGNHYFQEQEPWRTATEDPRLAAETIYNLTNLIKDISILVYPFMPGVAENIQKQLNLKDLKWKDIDKDTPAGHKVGPAELLFKKLDNADELKEKYSGQKTEDKEFMFDLRVAKITKVEDHPDADKLVVLQLDCGEKRQIVSGLKEFYKHSDLLHKNIILVSNLMISTLRGVESHGMLLAAEVDKKPVVVFAELSKPGEQLKISGHKVTDKVLSIQEFQKHNKLSVKDGKLFYGGHVLKAGKEEISVDAPDGSVVR